MRQLAVLLLAMLVGLCYAGDGGPAPVSATRVADIIYDRQDGTALTMDEFIPLAPGNGNVVVCVVSGGWYSDHDKIDRLVNGQAFQPFIDAGYRVYAVVHRSAPRFTLEEAFADVTRSIRFIREREAKDGRTSVSIGVVGASAGGHLSLMAGTAGDDGDANSADPVERQSSRVQAVACLFPPTDLLNYGGKGISVEQTLMGKYYYASIAFRQQFATKLQFKGGPYYDVTNEAARKKLLHKLSPMNHVSADDPPTLIVHGDADMVVPMQQSEAMVEELKQQGVKAKLDVAKGKGHSWPGIEKEFAGFVEWFDENLSRHEEAVATPQ